MKRCFVIYKHDVFTPNYKIDCSNYKLDFVFVIRAIVNNSFSTSLLHLQRTPSYKLQNFMKSSRGTCGEA